MASDTLGVEPGRSVCPFQTPPSSFSLLTFPKVLSELCGRIVVHLVAFGAQPMVST